VQHWAQDTELRETKHEPHQNSGISSCVRVGIWVKVMVFNATVNNISAISWRSVLLVEETGVPDENRQPVPVVQ
jgi:hypothetical protein